MHGDAVAVCPCGCRRSVLPPTAVRATLRGSGSSGLLIRLGTEGAAAAAAAGEAGGSEQQQQQQAGEAGARSSSPFAGAAAAAAAAPAKKDGGSRLQRKKSSWWRRLYGTKTLQWQDYRIGQPPLLIPPVQFSGCLF